MILAIKIIDGISIAAPLLLWAVYSINSSILDASTASFDENIDLDKILN